MTVVTIDINQLADLGTGNPLIVMGRLFLLGGWIPVVLIVLWGLKRVWLHSREEKYEHKLKFVLLAIDVPKENEQLPKAVENIFAHIHGARASVDFYEKWWRGKRQPDFGFEICSHGGYVQFYIHTQARYRDLVESAVFSQYPDSEINEVEDYADQFKGMHFPHNDYDIFGTEFVLDKPSYLPIRTYVEFEEKLAGEFKDPLGALLESLSKARPEEQIWIQVLAAPTNSDWKKAGEKYMKKIAGIKEEHKETLLQQAAHAPFTLFGEIVTHGSIITPGETEAVKKKEDSSGRTLINIPNVKEQFQGIATKINKPGFKAKIRFVYLAPKTVRNIGRVYPTIKGALNLFNALGMNKFTSFGRDVMPKNDYPWQRVWMNGRKNRLLYRYRKRSHHGAPYSVLNIEELATIWHFPVQTIKAPLLKKTESRRAEPPVGLPFARSLPGQSDTRANEPKKIGPRRGPTNIPFV